MSNGRRKSLLSWDLAARRRRLRRGQRHLLYWAIFAAVLAVCGLLYEYVSL